MVIDIAKIQKFKNLLKHVYIQVPLHDEAKEIV